VRYRRKYLGLTAVRAGRSLLLLLILTISVNADITTMANGFVVHEVTHDEAAGSDWAQELAHPSLIEGLTLRRVSDRAVPPPKPVKDTVPVPIGVAMAAIQETTHETDLKGSVSGVHPGKKGVITQGIDDASGANVDAKATKSDAELSKEDDAKMVKIEKYNTQFDQNLMQKEGVCPVDNVAIGSKIACGTYCSPCVSTFQQNIGGINQDLCSCTHSGTTKSSSLGLAAVLGLFACLMMQ